MIDELNAENASLKELIQRLKESHELNVEDLKINYDQQIKDLSS
jgi:hypothetical protein